MSNKELIDSKSRKWPRALWTILPMLILLALVAILSNGAEAAPGDFAITDDFTTDVDSDGLGEFLVLRAELDAPYSDHYSIAAEVMDNIGSFVYQSIVEVDLIEGPNVVDLRIPGAALSGNWRDGPYSGYASAYSQNYDFGAYAYFTTEPYLRTDFESHASLILPFQESTPDINDIPGYDSLDVFTTVDTLADGYYVISGSLMDANGYQICQTENVPVFLMFGQNEVKISFSAAAIAGHAVDGPFQVYVDIIWEYRVLLDYKEQTTTAFLADDFEKGCTLHESFYYSTYDSDDNGYADWLYTDTLADFARAGTYYCDSRLLNSEGTELGYWFWYGIFDVGTWTIYDTWDCMKTIPYGENGPFSWVVVVRDEQGNALDSGTYTTGIFPDSFFEGACIESELTIYAPDWNSNGLVDGIMVEFDVYTTKQMDFNAAGTLIDANGFVASSQLVYLYLGAGTAHCQIWFPGQSIFNSGLDGPYLVQIDLMDQYFEIIAQDTTLTEGYLAIDFDHAAFLPPFQESTTDCDTDGYFEYICIEVGLTLPESGSYSLEAVLNTFSDTSVARYWTEMVLEAGPHSCMVWFATNSIIEGGYDGPYYLDVWLYARDAWGQFLIATTSQITDAYAIADMESPAVVGPGITDSGYDEDGSGYFENIGVDIPILVACPGFYDVYCYLTDLYGGWITYSYYEDIYLDSGSNQLLFLLPGGQIHDSGLDGPYIVVVELVDIYLNYLDTEYHETSAYSHTDFDYLELTGAWTEAVVDDDGNGLNNALIIGLEVTCTWEQQVFVSYYLEKPGEYMFGMYSTTITVMPGTSYLLLRYEMLMAGSLQIDGPYYAWFELSSYDGYYCSGSLETSAWQSNNFDHLRIASDPIDRGLDQDMDGMFEYVEVELTIDSTIQGFCTVGIGVYDHYSNFLTSVYKDCLVHQGLNVVKIRMVGLAMMAYANGDTFILYCSINFGSTMVFGEYYQTQNSYDPSQFETIAWFSASPSYWLTDYDFDGLFEDLYIDVLVHVEFPQWYIVTATLWDDYGNYDFTRVEIFLLSGDQEVKLRFSGMSLAAKVMDAPWNVLVGLDDIDFNWLWIESIWIEECYIWQFEPIGSIVGIDEQAMDMDNDGKFEYIQADVQISLLSEGEFIIQAWLRDAESNLIVYSVCWTHLSAGEHDISLLLCGNDLWSRGMDGPYRLDVGIYDVSSYGISRLDYWRTWTLPYLASMFEDGSFVGQRFMHSDSGMDTDGDGLFEALEVHMAVFVHEAGVYKVRAILYENDWLLDISHVERKVHLKAGWQTVRLSFNGADIKSFGMNGPYGVEFYFMDDSGVVLDEKDMVTSIYLPEQFQGVEVSQSLKSTVIKISLKDKGALVLNIYGGRYLDVTRIDPASITMGSGISWIQLMSWSFEDCNKDGYLDLIIRFNMADVQTIVTMGMTTISFQMIYDEVLTEVLSSIAVRR